MKAPLLVDAVAAGRLCGVSRATWRRWNDAAKTPRPLKLSTGCVRWRATDIARWVELGCPDRDAFDTLAEE